MGYLLIIVLVLSIFFSLVSVRRRSRNPVSFADVNNVELIGFTKIRYLNTEFKPDVNIDDESYPNYSFLALSGGGANGAFGAGLMCGWTASGTRPDFKIVTGVSTGALIAPLVFLGSTYDEILKNCYTTISTKHILDVKGMFGFGVFPVLFGESYGSSKPLRELIIELSDEKVLMAIANEHARGKRLYIGTTYLDAQRFVIWDIGAIASSGRPDSMELIRKVIVASASVPGALAPVYFDVEANGNRYDEMHVDGGVITQVFGYGQLFENQSPKTERKLPCSIYVIRNGKLDTEYEKIPRKFFKILGRSLSTLMKAHSWNDLIRLYQRAKIDGVDFNYISIPSDFQPRAKEMFDLVEMNRLFDLGYEMAKSGCKWRKTVPGFENAAKEHFWMP